MKRTMSGLLAVMFLFTGFALLLLTPRESEAVPSFARQTGKSCAACHSIWPRLTKYGREFKMLAYTDIDPKLERITKDGLDIPRVFPLGLRVLNFPYSERQDSNNESVVPDEVELFFATRIAPNVGVLTEAVWEDGASVIETAKVGAAGKTENMIYGVVLGLMEPAGADPYNTLTRRLTRQRPAPLVAYRGVDNRFNISGDSPGVVANVLFNEMIYGAVGAFRGHENTDYVDLFGRAALEFPIGEENSIAVGGYVYDGKEEYAIPATHKSTTTRAGVDFQFQSEAGPHIIEVTAVYLDGTDKNVDNTGVAKDHNGVRVDAAYYLNRMYGLNLAYDSVEADEEARERRAWTIRGEYLPWLNIKLAAEYTDYSRFGTLSNPNDRNLTSVIVDFLF